MRTLAIARALWPVDLKNIRRDAGLIWFPIVPLVVALIIRWGVPAAARYANAQWSFDLTAYYPLIMSAFVLMAPSVIGMVIGFLLLDERDDQVLTALLVTPIPLNGYVRYRVALPLVLGLAATLLGYPIANLLPINPVDLLAVAALGSLTGPMFALVLAAFAPNKVAGFALVKLLNAASMLPIAAFFIGTNWQLIAGVFPSYWPLKVFWLAAQGQPYGGYLALGLAVNLLALWLVWQRFKMVVHR